MFDDELNHLRHVVDAGGNALEIDDALLPLIAHSDSRVITPILRLLNESGDQDGMWSILHTAESFNGSAYVTGLLAVLPELRQTSFWWSKTLVIRILNSATCSADLIHQLHGAPAPMKEAVSAICEKINEDARFHTKTAPVLAASMK